MGCIGGDTSTTMPNPASKHCADSGGKLVLVKSASGEYGICEFSGGAKCEEWAYLRGECSPEKPNYCAADDDCACGTHIKTRECFVGSKDFVNVQAQCPDYCTGIAGNLEVRCVNNQCKITSKAREEYDIGKECDSATHCPDGYGCYVLPGYKEARCYKGDPCALCGGSKCQVSGSLPSIVKCTSSGKEQGSGFCGWSTEGPCNSDSDCVHGGCSSQICQARSEGIIMSSCEFKECYKPTLYGVVCRCVGGKCKWA
ncbi:MAG: DUF333 domain-containing protein [Candidatus Micrarchaeota archaeon]|nr:DUF333 domain-containing protein [Candidatus Micrarchaeota archaeon]